MKREYMTPKAELVNFNFDNQVVVASGVVGNYGTGLNIDRCQQASTSCTAYYTPNKGCGSSGWPEE